MYQKKIFMNLPIRNSIKVLLLNHKNEVLLMCADDPKTVSADGKYYGRFWFPIGGKIEEGESVFDQDRKEDWSWTSMIMQPDSVTKKIIEDAKIQVMEKKNPPSLSTLRFESYHEGLSVQIMHIGPWSEEAPNIERIHAHAEEQGYKLRGKHHEIYLSDPRRTAPEKLKTVIRQPIE